MSSGAINRSYIKNNHAMSHFFLVLLIILSSKSLYFEMFGTNIFTIFTFIIVFFVFFKEKKTIRIDVLIFGYLFLLVSIISLDFDIKTFILMLIKTITVIMLISIIKFEVFSLHYSKIIKFIAFVSILTYPIIFFKLSSPLFNFISIDERIHENFILFGVLDNHIAYGVYRINGLWWEPGAFHFFLTISFLFDFLYERLNKRSTIFYIIMSLLIGSTTGLLSIILILLSKNVSRLNLIKSIYLVIILFFIFLLFKYTNISNKFDLDSSMSLLSRYYDFLISYNMFLENPLVGYGLGNQIEKAIPFGIDLLGYNTYFSLAKPTGSDGITMFISQVGLLGFIFAFFLLFPNYGSVKISTLGRCFIALALLITFNTQNFIFLIIFNVLVLYSFSSWRGLVYHDKS
ncbi:TPA: hypothetical protein RSW61_001375 [Vibrio harveyi]|nr:hypothetical protein [Vibrio harveyi]